MADNVINIKLTVDGKEANASLQLTDSNIQKIIDSVNRANDNNKKLGNNLVGQLTDIRNSVQGLREAYGVVQNVFAKPIQLAIQKEQFQTAFAVLLGSVDKAEQRISELSEFAKTTPFQLPEVINASRQLEVLTGGALSTGDGLRLVGDVAAGTGVRIDELSTWFGRLYDGIQSGRPVGEALMRLQELGVISGSVRGKIEDLAKSGRLSAEGWDVITEAMSRFDGMMQKQSETLGGKLSNLEDSFGQLQTTIGGTVGVALEPLISGMTNLITTVYNISPELAGMAGTVVMLSAAYTLLGTTGIGSTIKGLMTMGPTLQSLKVQKLEHIIMTRSMTAAEQAEALAAYEAAIATKGFFTSLGPIGWALLGITALATVWGLVGDSAEDAANKQEEYNQKLSAMNMDDLKTGIGESADEVVRLGEEYVKAGQYVEQLQRKQYEGNDINEQIARDEKAIASLQEYQVEIQEKIKSLKEEQIRLTEEIKKREEQLKQTTRQNYDSMQADMKKGWATLLGGEKAGQVEAERQDLEKRKKILHDKYVYDVKIREEDLKNNAQYQEELKNLENYSKANIKEIQSKGQKNKKSDTAKNQEAELSETQRHQEALAKIQGKSELDQLKLKREHLNQMLEFYKKHKKDVTKIKNEIEEVDAEIRPLQNFQDFYDSARSSKLDIAPASTMQAPKKKMTDDDRRALGDMEYDLADDKTKADMDYMQQKKEINDLVLENEFDANGRLVTAAEKKNQLMTKLEQRHARVREKIASDEAEHKLAVTSQVLGNLAGLFGEHTAAYKALAIAQATIDTYRGAAAALSPPPVGAGPVLGPILAGTTIAMGLANVAKIMSTENPKMPGYERGGIVVGEKGPEIIAPMDSYAEGQAELVNRTVLAVDARLRMYRAAESGSEDVLLELRALNRLMGRYAENPAPVVIGDNDCRKIAQSGTSKFRRGRV